MNVRRISEKPLLVSCLLAAGFSTDVLAQAVNDASATTADEIVITGVRGRPRSLADSPVPVDVFSAEEIESVSYTDTNDVLMTLVPSYSVSRQPISDGGTFIRPAQLRGMPTDKTLVLVNGKRRHRAALVGIGGSGTQGPDIATIPSSAIKNVEVLRDGAAAQYGSDAIAGVINFQLKDNTEGGSLSIDTGTYSEGDGDAYTITGNIGMPIFGDGFLSISGEVSDQESTSRGVQYCESWFCVDDPDTYPDMVTDPDAFYQAALSSANTNGESVVQPWGQPNADAARIFFNAGIPLDNGAEIYAFGNYSQSESDGPFFYRYPQNGTIEYLREPDGSLYTPLEKFPGGFTPRFSGEVHDTSMAGGYRGDLTNGLSYDLSARWGESEIQYTLMNTINPSMGPDSPTSFEPGDLVNEELQVQADFAYEFDAGLASPAVFAFGLSYLDESYEIVEGEPDSYRIGSYAVPDPFDLCVDGGTTPTAAGAAAISGGSSLDCADENDPVYTTQGPGSNGFPGYSPDFSDKYSRDSLSLYTDLSADLTDKLFLQGALRYEDYSDFDSEVVYKIAGMYSLTETVNVRASVGSGFRAPTPGQQGTTNVSTRLPDGFPVNVGLFPASGPIAGALGATPLKPEKSDNFTLGMTYTGDKLSLTVDFYRIDVQDRFYAISTLDVSNDPTSGDAYTNYQALEAVIGTAAADGIGGVNYFTNAFDTSTSGVDVVATYPLEWSAGTTSLQASLNYNKSEFDSDPGEFFNDEDQYDFENLDPRFRGVFTATHMMEDLSLTARAKYFGDSSNSNGSDIQDLDPVVQVDLEGVYAFNETWAMALGGRNIFDTYPDKDEIGDYCCGRIYSSGTMIDWQGSYWYLRLNANF